MGFVRYAPALASDPLSICGEEEMAALACIFEYQKQCPELSAMFGGVSQQELESQCGILSGLCASATACMQNSMPSMNPPASVKTHAFVPFVIVPYLVGMVCGQLKEFKMCFDSAEGQCPQLDARWQNTTGTIWMEVRRQYGNFPEADKVKTIIKNDCPTVPAGFAASSCLEQKLTSQAYLNCVNEAKGNDTGVALSCEVYDRGNMCLKTALVPECGQDHYDAIIRFSRFFLNGLPTNCPTGAATTVHVSLLTLVLVAVTLLFT